jgi:hypothetical protein
MILRVAIHPKNSSNTGAINYDAAGSWMAAFACLRTPAGLVF